MIAYGKVKTRDFHRQNGDYLFCTVYHPVVVKKAVERRRNKPLRYPRLHDECRMAVTDCRFLSSFNSTTCEVNHA